MPSVYRRRRLGRRLGRRFGRRYWSRSWYKRSFGRNYNSSRSSCSVVIPVEQVCSANMNAGSVTTDVIVINPWIHLPVQTNFSLPRCYPGGMVNSDLYRRYIGLYDEVKLRGITMDISFANAVGAGGNFNAVTVVTAWDRKGSKADTATSATYPDVNVVEQNGSCVKNTFVNNSIGRLSRSIWARDLMEKANWIDASNVAASVAVSGYTASNCVVNEQWNDANTNVNFFAPTFMMFVRSQNAPASVQQCNFLVSIKYYVEFRNPKFGASGSAKSEESKSEGTGELEEVFKKMKVSEGVSEDDGEMEEKEKGESREEELE